jgi:hypothetical protein
MFMLLRAGVSRAKAALVSARGTSERTGDLIVTYNHIVAVYVLPGSRSASP